MTSTRVRAIIGRREIILTIDTAKHFTETEEGHNERALRLIADHMQAMGIKDWKAGFATKAAEQDGNALTTLLHSRRSDGADVSLTSLLSPKRPRKSKQRKYPK